MKKLIVAFMFAAILTVALVGPVMAAGPSNDGQGRDIGSDPPPNDVYVPSAAFENRGETPPGNVDNNGAIFHEAGISGG